MLTTVALARLADFFSYSRRITVRSLFIALLISSYNMCKREKPISEENLANEPASIESKKMPSEKCDGKLIQRNKNEICAQPQQVVLERTLKNNQVVKVYLQKGKLLGHEGEQEDQFVLKYGQKKIFSRSSLALNDIDILSVRYAATKYFQIGGYDVFIIITNTQGAHCCAVVDVISFDPKGKIYISKIPTPDEINFEDIDKDGMVDAITGNYLDYFHESHADSPEADIYFRFKNGKFMQDKKSFYKIYERIAKSYIKKIRANVDSEDNKNANLIASAAFYYVYLNRDELALKLYLENGYKEEIAKSLIRELHERVP